MDDSTFDRIFAGSFYNIPKVRHPLVRIYTSSTFTDMSLEKNVLVTEVYPKLKEYCREKYGLEFQEEEEVQGRCRRLLFPTFFRVLE